MAHACETKLAKGYGMTELSSAVCVCIKNECNELGSVGIPLPLVDAEIRNPITKERIKATKSLNNISVEAGDAWIFEKRRRE